MLQRSAGGLPDLAYLSKSRGYSFDVPLKTAVQSRYDKNKSLEYGKNTFPRPVERGEDGSAELSLRCVGSSGGKRPDYQVL